jgi:Type ISP C-terminal specificity domain/N-6 DNA Methylase
MNPLDIYLKNLHEIYITGSGVKETSYYGALESLLNDIGNTLSPKVRCIINLRNQGAGIPDGGLFSAHQFRKNQEGEPFTGILPERGVIEIKSTKDDLQKIIASEQVIRYWEKYRQVLVTNYREFILVGEDNNGDRIELECYKLANSEAEFWQKTSKYRQFASEHEGGLIEYLKRVMLQSSAITSPQDVAWFLASYARDAKSRLDSHEDLPVLTNIRTALENALGVKFTGEKGDRFFRSTLVQTLFYGIFSAWVLWHKNNPDHQDQFDWKTSAYYLHVPMIQALFEQIARPSKLRELNLVEVLDWTGSALNRVNRNEFFTKFDEGQAVQYFYEPFLEAFDPQLRKELGVWYTPPEIVKYMVERVDMVLREELEIEDGLANENVYILDPCCGTGAYLVEVLRKIAQILEENGEGALSISQVKEAAKNRVFGFEILTAPFVIAHLQLGLILQNLGVPLQEENERLGVYLTNALTGWQPPDEEAKKKLQQLEMAFPELNKEKEAADEIKRGKPILVVLGNPPYNAYSGTSPTEEEGLVEVYKEGLIKEWAIKKLNLDDLYVRFFRLAEKCISENTKKGVVCYISNFSYLGDPSFVVMRKRFLNEFDHLWFDCLNGDSRETGKVTPDGKPDPSVFSTEYNKEGIRVGTAISLMVRKEQRLTEPVVRFRHFWGVTKRQDITKSLENINFNSEYEIANPTVNNRYNFRPSDVEDHYYEWAKLTDLCAIEPLQGLDEDRGFDLIDIDREKLIYRMQSYFNAEIEWDDLKLICKRLTQDGADFIAKDARKKVLSEESFLLERVMKCDLRQFDKKWAYYTTVNPLWKRPRPSLYEQYIRGNSFLISRASAIGKDEGKPMLFTTNIFARETIKGKKAVGFPLILYPTSKSKKKSKQTTEIFNTEVYTNIEIKANLSEKARLYLSQLGITNPDENIETAGLIWMHSLAIGYSSEYLTENADGIKQDFPRIPLPNTPELLLNSAQLGREIAQLLNTENNVLGVTTKLRPELKQIAVISRVGGGQLNPDQGELAITTGWGHSGQNNVTMPGKGKIIERPYTTEELTAIQQGSELLNMNYEQVLNLLGKTTCDLYLNDLAYGQNVPIHVYNYTIGGYQVIKKWLSYREEKLLGRSLKIEEVKEVMNMCRRITALILLEPKLNHNYQQVKSDLYSWS